MNTPVSKSGSQYQDCRIGLVARYAGRCLVPTPRSEGVARTESDAGCCCTSTESVDIYPEGWQSAGRGWETPIAGVSPLCPMCVAGDRSNGLTHSQCPAYREGDDIAFAAIPVCEEPACATPPTASAARRAPSCAAIFDSAAWISTG